MVTGAANKTYKRRFAATLVFVTRIALGLHLGMLKGLKNIFFNSAMQDSGNCCRVQLCVQHQQSAASLRLPRNTPGHGTPRKNSFVCNMLASMHTWWSSAALHKAAHHDMPDSFTLVALVW